jgi:hypothetical protein
MHSSRPFPCPHKRLISDSHSKLHTRTDFRNLEQLKPLSCKMPWKKIDVNRRYGGIPGFNKDKVSDFGLVA